MKSFFYPTGESLMHAFRGIRYVFRHELNFRIQLSASVGVLALLFFFHVRRSEVLVILLLIMLVLLLELLNSAMEKFVDVVVPRFQIHVATIKDILAGMVFTASFGAFIIGIIIFTPYMIEFFSS